MGFQFRSRDIEQIAVILGVPPKPRGNNYRFEIEQRKTGRSIALEIYPDIPIGKTRGSLISVYTPNAHLQLHFCTGFVVSKMLGEITFVGEHNGKLSGLIIEREGGCSLYANVDRAILSGDFTTLGPEVMLSGIALSLTESILPAPQKTDSGEGTKAEGGRRNARLGRRTAGAKKRKSARRK